MSLSAMQGGNCATIKAKPSRRTVLSKSASGCGDREGHAKARKQQQNRAPELNRLGIVRVEVPIGIYFGCQGTKQEWFSGPRNKRQVHGLCKNQKIPLATAIRLTVWAQIRINHPTYSLHCTSLSWLTKFVL